MRLRDRILPPSVVGYIAFMREAHRYYWADPVEYEEERRLELFDRLSPEADNAFLDLTNRLPHGDWDLMLEAAVGRFSGRED